MQVAQLKSLLEIGVLIGKAVAPHTKTTVDDRAVALAEKLLANDAVLAIVAQLLGGAAATPAPALSTADAALLAEVEAHLPAVRALVTSASAVC